MNQKQLDIFSIVIIVFQVSVMVIVPCLFSDVIADYFQAKGLDLLAQGFYLLAQGLTAVLGL